MSEGGISENSGARSAAARAQKGLPSIADPVPVGIVAFAHVANATWGKELIPTWPLLS